MIINKELADLVSVYDWDKDLLELIDTNQEININLLYDLPTKKGTKELSVQLEHEEKEYYIPIKCFYFYNKGLNKKLNLIELKRRVQK